MHFAENSKRRRATKFAELAHREGGIDDCPKSLAIGVKARQPHCSTNIERYPEHGVQCQQEK
jgi:hypothetical protein